MRQTKVRETIPGSLCDEPLEDLPEPLRFAPEQLTEAQAREEQRRREWAEINEALRDHSTAVTRAISRWSSPAEGERQAEGALNQFESGSFLIDRLGAAGVIDQNLAVVLLDLRRRLLEEYGRGPATTMLIDKAVAAYQDFIRVQGWIGNLALRIEHELFGMQGPSAEFQDRYGRDGRKVRGLTVEQHLTRLREGLLPLAERCGRAMRDALAELEALSLQHSRAVEIAKPLKISLDWGAADEPA